MLCSCGQCGEGDVKSEGKAYKTRNVLICPYHSLAYQIECERSPHHALISLCVGGTKVPVVTVNAIQHHMPNGGHVNPFDV